MRFYTCHYSTIGLATGAMVSGSPLICGGWSSSGIHDECYFMDLEQKSWKFLTNMGTKRAESASVAIKTSLFVTGGHDGGEPLSTTEYIHADGNILTGPDLPSPRAGHCMVALPSGKAMIIGGYATNKATLGHLVGLNN